MNNSVSQREKKKTKQERQWIFGLTTISLEHYYGKLNKVIFFIPYSIVTS